MTRRGGREASERDREGREAAGDGATSRSVKAFLFGDILTLKKKRTHPGKA